MKLLFFILLLCSSSNGIAQRESGGKRDVTAIIGAMETEVELLKAALQQRADTTIEGIHFYTGNLNDKAVVIARCGIGKVNAAIITTLLMEHFKPARLLFSGIAGSLNPSLQPGDVIIGSRVAYHDYGRKLPDSFETWATKNPYDFAYNPVYFPCDSLLLVLAKQAAHNVLLQPVEGRSPTIQEGTIITGDILLSDGALGNQLRRRTNADAIEMEGAAVAQVCYQRQVPFLIIRSLSDNANHSAALDFNRYGKIAAANSAAIILRILGHVRE